MQLEQHGLHLKHINSIKSLYKPLERSFLNFCIAANCFSGSSEYKASTTSGENIPYKIQTHFKFHTKKIFHLV